LQRIRAAIILQGEWSALSAGTRGVERGEGKGMWMAR